MSYGIPSFNPIGNISYQTQINCLCLICCVINGNKLFLESNPSLSPTQTFTPIFHDSLSLFSEIQINFSHFPFNYAHAERSVRAIDSNRWKWIRNLWSLPEVNRKLIKKTLKHENYVVNWIRCSTTSWTLKIARNSPLLIHFSGIGKYFCSFSTF